MTGREALHALIDELPETHLGLAQQTLEDMRRSQDPLAWALAHAPIDDEPDDDDFDGGLTEAREQADRGELIPHEEVKRSWGLE